MSASEREAALAIADELPDWLVQSLLDADILPVGGDFRIPGDGYRHVELLPTSITEFLTARRDQGH